MIFTTDGTLLTINEFTKNINSAERIVMFLFENNVWYKYSYVRDDWESVNINIEYELNES